MKKHNKLLKYLFLVIIAILMGLSLMLFPFLIGSEDKPTAVIGYSYLIIFIITSLIMFFMLRKELTSPTTKKE